MDYAATYNRNRGNWLYELARDGKVSATGVRVGLLFATFFVAESREEVGPSYEWIMESAHVANRNSVSKAIKQLESAGFLLVYRMHRYRNRYSMPFDGEKDWNR